MDEHGALMWFGPVWLFVGRVLRIAFLSVLVGFIVFLLDSIFCLSSVWILCWPTCHMFGSKIEIGHSTDFSVYPNFATESRLYRYTYKET